MVFVLFLCIIGIVLSAKPKNEELQSAEEEIMQGLDTNTLKVFYTEEDDMVGYNYIINPETLREQGLYVQHIQTIPDEINRVLQKNGYEGEPLKITGVEKKGTRLMFQIVVLSDKTIKQCEYSYRNGTFKISE